MEMSRTEDLRQLDQTTRAWPSNDNRRRAVFLGRSVLPKDAVARIFRPSRSVITSGKAGTKGWRLAFERRSAPFIEPLMGQTGGQDTLTQVELSFPTLEAAIRYAERQSLSYVVQSPQGTKVDEGAPRRVSGVRAFSDATLDRLGLAALQESYGHVMADPANRNDPVGRRAWHSAIDIDMVSDPGLSPDAKRSILMNWACTEYLIDQVTNEGMPENGRPSRLDEVKLALLALENGPVAKAGDAQPRQAA